LILQRGINKAQLASSEL